MSDFSKLLGNFVYARQSWFRGYMHPISAMLASPFYHFTTFAIFMEKKPPVCITHKSACIFIPIL